MKEIVLTNGGVTLVDDLDYDFLNQWNWRKNELNYVYRGTTYRDKKTGQRRYGSFRIHRIIMMAHQDTEVDHINRDPLDNRRCNLRLVTSRENKLNTMGRPTRRRHSKYPGITKIRYGWVPYISVNGKQIKFRARRTEREAFEVTVRESQKQLGEFSPYYGVEIDKLL
jgi:hypothetical protein